MVHFISEKISRKILLGLSTLVLLCFVIALVSLWSLSESNRRLTSMYEREVIGIERADALKGAAYRIRSSSLEYILAKRAVTRKQIESKIDHQAKRFKRILSDVRKTATNEEKEALLQAVDATTSAYIQLIQGRLYGLIESGKVEAADDLARKEAVEIFREAREAVNGYMDYSVARAESRYRNSQAVYAKTSMALVVVLILSFLVGCFVAWFLNANVSKALSYISLSMKKLAQGDLESDIPYQNRRDEIGEMSKAVLVFKDNAIKRVELEAGQEKQKQQAEEEKRVMMHKLADEFDANVGGIVESVSSASTELQATAESMSGIAQNTSSMSAAVSAASEEASTNVQTVASAAEEMSHSISEINNRVTEASSAIQTAVSGIADTGEQMQNLAKTADNISDVVKLISDIAEQTNLLALNATIESARAGEAGRGFAVVASEVKALASQTAKATEGISVQVEEIQKATKEAVVSMEHIGKSIQAVDETSAAIAAAMEEQGSATQEIARNVQEAASGTEEVSRNIVGVNQASGEAGAAAEQVTSAAGELSQQAEMLKGEVSKFISQVRTG